MSFCTYVVEVSNCSVESREQLSGEVMLQMKLKATIADSATLVPKHISSKAIRITLTRLWAHCP